MTSRFRGKIVATFLSGMTTPVRVSREGWTGVAARSGGPRRLGQDEAEAGAATGHVLRPDFAAVRFDHPLGDRQAEAGPALVTRAGLLAAVKPLEDEG